MDRSQLTKMARQAKEVTGAGDLTVLADRGYFSGKEVVACEAAGVTPIVPKPLTSGAEADGRFRKQDFIHQPETDTYRCPAGEQLIWRATEACRRVRSRLPSCRALCSIRGGRPPA